MKKSSTSRRKTTVISVAATLRKHFRQPELHRLMTNARMFPVTARVDLQQALEDLISEHCVVRHQSGIQAGYAFQTFTFSMLSMDRDRAAILGPLEHEDVDVGEAVPVVCLKSTFWLCDQGRRKIALLLTPVLGHGQITGWQVEVAEMPGKDAARKPGIEILSQLEEAINKARSYRGKVISLQKSDDYSGKVGSVRVHKLRSVAREEVILPAPTLKLLEQNVTEFIQKRDRLKSLGMSIKKGLLFYGPPGTGKTHTIHYLASQLAEHTTLLITAEQVGMLDEYMQLARLMQPAMIVLEDVDLIARTRTSMRNPCEEGLLNKLLNEMDGLREDAALLFVLTTNRPEDLESALASRPGRIDQAIEFPLPDEEGRRKLVKLYAGSLQIPDDVVSVIVRKTSRASAAFIKELMRRAAQVMLRQDRSRKLSLQDVESALDEMLFSGGSLNAKLLGGAATE
jgi:hypothetical protein